MAGRPEKPINREEFEKLCNLQCTLTEICNFFGCDPKTLEKWCFNTYNLNFSQIFCKKRGGGKVSLRRTQFRLAENNAAMAIFLGKNYLGQSDNPMGENADSVQYCGIPAHLVAPKFAEALFDIADNNHSEYVFTGGRGSAKSSFVSLCIIDLIMKNSDIHAAVFRQVAETVRSSVYSQIVWAISKLGLDGEFKKSPSNLEITRKSTGQKIFFRGADDPDKIKSIKPETGYIGVLWFEELDQFHGEEAVRKIEQSAARGGNKCWIFKSFNPPKSAVNWANRSLDVPRADRLVTRTVYLDVPQKWLGKKFIQDAEFLRESNPAAYENEYLGIANGSGGGIFGNVVLREISDDEISRFDNIFNGVDWGWYPDPFAFVRCHYDSGRQTLFIWQEFTCLKQTNDQTADALKQLGISSSDLIVCDSAEMKSVSDYRALGLSARPAEKGAGSREASYRWLQGLRHIVIDPVRCPRAAEEFASKEYERDRDGNVLSGYPDGNDHCIDAVRYALERVWKRSKF